MRLKLFSLALISALLFGCQTNPSSSTSSTESSSSITSSSIESSISSSSEVSSISSIESSSSSSGSDRVYGDFVDAKPLDSYTSPLKIEQVYSSKSKSIHLQTTVEDIPTPVAYDENAQLGTSAHPLSTAVCHELTITMIQLTKEYGDAFIITCDGASIVIDAGQAEDRSVIVPNAMHFLADKHINLVVQSHAHADHYGGFASYGQSIISSVDYIVDYGYQPTFTNDYVNNKGRWITGGAKYCTALESVNNQNSCSKRLYVTSELYIDWLDTGLYLDTEAVAPSDQNPHSVTGILNFKEFSFFFGGDLTGPGESASINDPDFHKTNMFKVNHHGSNTHGSNGQALINALNPQVVAVSAAIVNESNINQPHPNMTTIRRLYSCPNQQSDKNIYFNGTFGTTHFTTDGLEYIEIRGMKSIKPYKVNGVQVGDESSLEFSKTAFYSYNN